MSELSNSDVRVLVVEDDEDCRIAVVECLKMSKFQVVAVCDGAEAMQVTAFNESAGQPFDIMLLDLVMPQMDGFAVLRQYAGPTPVVVLSAWSDMKDLPREPFGTMIKPFDLKELREIIHKAARQRRSVAA